MTPDQEALVGLAAEIMAGRTSNEQLAKTEVSESRVDEELWRELVEAGLLGIAVPERLGGAGLGLAELCLLLEQQGRFVAPVPLWENLLAAYILTWHATESQQSQWIPPFLAGTAKLGVAASLDGPSPVTVSDGRLEGRVLVTSKADVLVVVTEEGLYLCQPPAGEPVATTNHALAYDVDLTGVGAERLDADVESVRNHLRVGLAAVALGVADAGIREAARHLSQREQFGRSLATFQATTFQLGDAYCDAQAMRATLWQAVWALDGGAATPETAVAAWWATDAAERIQHTVQHLHGGLGADTTYPVHRRLLWTMRTNALLGGPSRQLVRLGSALVG
jgi:alkylation response protein AidB-like acyl-CoA dehydrogenase